MTSPTVFRPTVSLAVLACAALLVTAVLASAAALPQPASAAGVTLYVDGKHGHDGNNGRSWGEAYKTINHAARQVPRGTAAAGWTIVVRGYADYIYRERPVPGSYARAGTAQSPLVFTAEGWSPGATNYVKPIVSGALLAPKTGARWHADQSAGVWWTPWSSAPARFDRSKPYTAAVFQGRTTWLWQHASLADLRGKAGRGDGGYWWDAGSDRLYVATRNGVDPSSVTIDVPTFVGFYFTGTAGARHIVVRGFVVQHASMGIQFHLGADHNTAVDNDAVANNPMGFGTSGRETSSGFDPAVGNVFLRNTATYNTQQGFKIDAGSQDTVICHNSVQRNAAQGIKVLGPMDGSDPRATTGTEVCHNLLAHQSTQRIGSARQDERPNGLTLADGARGTYVHHNTIRDNVVGIQVNQGRSGSPIANTVVKRNQVHTNRIGLSLRDGVDAARMGSGSFELSYNLYWDNGVGIRIFPGSTNKTFKHETIYANREDGVTVGCFCGSLARASAVISESLVTHNAGHGVAVVNSGVVRLRYSGLASNGLGPTSGQVDRLAVNTRPAGYLSRDEASADFLRIGRGSFQYTAGPENGPIGARY
ncbi:MAG TPA: right-handed parallel beta-helix repeat-containing protein [Candidatus Limnocylindria bacterium]|nr:right-handed parallel beta-helix repeat-containing protein [Candidatus Limnocylindria bacterium]